MCDCVCGTDLFVVVICGCVVYIYMDGYAICLSNSDIFFFCLIQIPITIDQ
jgi:hypothetical protein